MAKKNQNVAVEVAVETIVTLVRANTLTITVDSEKAFVATYHRTHKHIATIKESDTTFTRLADATPTQNRESFRQHMASTASNHGIAYQPEDMRDPRNMVRPTYLTVDDVTCDVDRMISNDLIRWLEEINIDKQTDYILSGVDVETCVPMTKTGKGTVLADLGILDGRYAKGHMAWFQLEVVVTITSAKLDDSIGVLLEMQMVSGQLAKPKHINDGGYTKAGLIKELVADKIIPTTMATIEVTEG